MRIEKQARDIMSVSFAGWKGNNFANRERYKEFLRALITKEQIVMSAIRHEKTVFTGKRHHHILHALFRQGLKGHRILEQGFVTSKHRFVNRYEGWMIAVAAGQVKDFIMNFDDEDCWVKMPKDFVAKGNMMFSEDLY